MKETKEHILRTSLHLFMQKGYKTAHVIEFVQYEKEKIELLKASRILEQLRMRK
jgi:hypothetical protein